MRTRIRKSVGVLLVAISIAVPMGRAQQQPTESEIEKEMFDLANKERTQRGIPQLQWSEKLAESARKHAQRLADTGMLSHQFNGEPNLTTRISAAGLHFNASAENVALATHADDMHPGLMHSQGHRDNILNPRYNAVGIGVVKRDDHYYAAENFARVTEDYSSTEAEGRFADAMNQLRTKLKLQPFVVMADPQLREGVCKMAKQDMMAAKMLPALESVQAVSVFNALDLDDPPKELRQLAGRPEVRKLFVGACFAVTNRYPGGTYWFGVEY